MAVRLVGLRKTVLFAYLLPAFLGIAVLLPLWTLYYLLTAGAVLESSINDILLFMCATLSCLLIVVMPGYFFFLRLQRRRILDSFRGKNREIKHRQKAVSESVKDRRRTERELASAHDRFRVTMDSLDAAVYVSDLVTHKILFANKRVTEIWGDVVGKPCWQVLQRDQIGPCSDCSNPYLVDRDGNATGVYAWECQNSCNGQWFECRDSAIEWTDGRLVRLEIAMNISARKSAEEVLRQSEESLAITMNSLAEGVIATNSEGRIIQMNPIAEKMTGWSLFDAQFRPLTEVFIVKSTDVDTDISDPVRSIMASGATTHVGHNLTLTALDRTRVQIDCNGAPMRDDSGDTVGTVLVFRDITENVQLQERLRRSEKMDAIGQLAGGVAHDFNNMLGAITGAAQLLYYSIAPEEEAKRKHIDIILEASARAADLTSELLAFARKGKVKPVVMDLNHTVRKVISILKHTIDKRIRIEMDLDSQALKFTGEQSQVLNAILNIAINARDAMPDGGYLRFATSVVTLDEYDEEAGVLQPKPFYEVAISDTGKGMPEEVQNRIFEPFFTTKEVGKGTGLGLAAVYGIIKSHDGRVEVFSEEDKGTVFKIYLPAERRDEPVEFQQEDEKVYSGNGRILFADDEQVMHVIAQEMLQRLGYSVDLAQDGAEAVEIYRNRFHEFDLVILDLVMPKLNGHDAFREIRKINEHAKVVISSGFNLTDQDTEKLFEAGAAAFVQKPYRIANFSQVIHRAIKGDDFQSIDG